MDVVIQESRFSFRRSYRISSSTGSEMVAIQKFWSLLPNLSIYAENSQVGNGQILARIHKTAFFRSRYDFSFASGPIYRLARTSIWKSVHVCEAPGHKLEYFEHRGLRGSIFHNDRQVAAVQKSPLVLGSGHQFEIRMDSDADVLLIACMVIAVNTTDTEGEKDEGFFHVDLGRIGPQGRAFDETWRPR